jgi:hypothetical protein
VPLSAFRYDITAGFANFYIGDVISADPKLSSGVLYWGEGDGAQGAK